MATVASQPATQPPTPPKSDSQASPIPRILEHSPELQKDITGLDTQTATPASSNGGSVSGLSRKRSRTGPRSRSGTATSVASSCYSQASTMVDGAALYRPTSQIFPAVTSPSETSMTESLPGYFRSNFFSSGRVMRRQGSKVSLGASEISSEEPDKRLSSARRLLGLGLDRNKRDKSRRRPETTYEPPKPRPVISSPFDFHHVSHTERTQRAARDGDIYSSLQHMRTPSRTLNGIKATDLPHRRVSHPPPIMEQDVEVPTSPESGSVRPQVSPVKSPESPPVSPLPVTGRGLNHSRSADSFSQPRTRLQTQSMSIAMQSPPPRKSSRAALEGRPTILEDLIKDLNTEKPLPSPSEEVTEKPLPPPADEALEKSLPPPPPEEESEPPTGVWEFSLGDHQQNIDDDMPAHDEIEEDDAPAFSHAVTTDIPVTVTPVPVIEVLESVLEDLESQAASPQEPQAETEDTVTDVPEITTRRSSRLLPRPLALKGATRVPRPESSMSLAPAFSPIGREFPPTPVQNTFGNTQDYESWEQDVDYCYDHAAESHEDYDWVRTSTDTRRPPTSDGENLNRLSDILNLDDLDDLDSPGLSQHRRSRATRPSLYVPDVDAVPDLARRRSAHSASTYPSSVRTPSVVYSPVFPDTTPMPEHLQEYLNAQPKYHAMREDAYAEYVADCLEAERSQYPMLNPHRHTHLSSARLSKSSSYDDSSDFTGSCSLHSSLRRSAGSVGSLPDLVHSTQYNHSHPARRDNRTSMASPSDRFTFFAATADDADEHDLDHAPERPHTQSQPQPQPLRTPPPTPASVYSAPAYAPPPPPTHERSVSDSAFKLLSLSSTSPRRTLRKRSATLAQAPPPISKAPLSLFPPPRVAV
ncbi:hypothetical protein EJ05DRAFT_502591 [Pseudovirgaria hyperparasitica]|uniref:CRIB domain-containing protein n=1 Tax=Pseudovirgaria hyperparasitica TaxID=470096 RepID=A0A6A6W0T8_9PEZI|nr:uncharacterized protein EJ05DRAFT_502591 [Pseudovirgaria hyperparasitica]KAF2756125.1 hypothetical protein EJ05DRAFT_502591 [Pseudovirgaria hyperparasitica]